MVDRSNYTTYTWYMSQITIYMPAALVRDLKNRAKRARTSVSAYLAALVRREATPPVWSKGFLSSFGAWKGEGIEEPDELGFERRARLK